MLPRLVAEGDPLRLWALSDLHVSHPENREALARLPARPDDWLILAGDVSHGAQRLEQCFAQLTPKFRQVVWVPGNHELWTIPDAAPGLRGVALYEHLVAVARTHGVLTPEDPHPVVELPDGPVLIAPLFLLYDYSFRPGHVRRDGVVRWARETRAVCSDEVMLHPDPFPDRDSWCAARCETPPPGSRRLRPTFPSSWSITIRSRSDTPCCRGSPASRPGAGPAGRGVGTGGSTRARWCTVTSTSGTPTGSMACPSRRSRWGIRDSGTARGGSAPTCGKSPWRPGRNRR